MKTTFSEGRWLALVMMAAAFTGCQQRRENLALWELEQSRIELEERLHLLEYKLELHDGGKVEEYQAVSSNLEATSRQKLELTAQRATLQAEITALEKQTLETEMAWMRQQRSKALGTSFDRFTTKDGRILEKASVSKIDDSGVSIRHEHGAAKLGFDDLTREQQDLFGMVESKADAAENRERIASAAYHRQMDQQLQIAQAAAEGQKWEAENSKQSRALASSSRPNLASSYQSESPTAIPSSNPLHQPATRVGRDRSWSSYTYGVTGRPTYRYVYPSYRYKRDFKQESTGLIVIPNPYTGSRTINGN